MVAGMAIGAQLGTPALDDEYYPPEEPAEHAAIVWPRLVQIKPGIAALQRRGEPAKDVSVGGRYGDFDVVAVIAEPGPFAVLERNFNRWGVLAYIGKSGPVVTMRKAVGRLDGLLPPARPFPAGYYDRLLSAQEDVLGNQVLEGGKDPSYTSLANLLPPLDSYTFLGTVSSIKKIIVQPDGQLGYGGAGRRGELEQVLFDPWAVSGAVSPVDISKFLSKKGLVGGYLPVIDFGFYNSSHASGFEEIAFAVGNGPAARICLRTPDGKRIYSTADGTQATNDGTTFYRDLLAVYREWDSFFAKAMRIQVPERRVQDSSRAGIVRALISYVGIHPKYGSLAYWEDVHETFPPTTLLFNSVLLDLGFTTEARRRLGYYLSKFVKEDGTFAYYGPAVSEYGQMLALAARCARLTADVSWMETHLPALERIGNRLLAQRTAIRGRQKADSPAYGLLYGAAEADTRKDQAFYFSGDVWCWRGLLEMGQWMSERGASNGDSRLAGMGKQWLAAAGGYREDILKALNASVLRNTEAPFLPPIAGSQQAFERMTESIVASYTNYRYWLEMLSPELLTPEMRDNLIAYRTTHGGELLATTRFLKHLDDWPYSHYAWGLLDSDQVQHYLLGFYGHLAHHLTPGTLTSYEQIAIEGSTTRRHMADYCVPVQLVIPQLLRWALVWEPWSKEALWLARAVPQSWFAQGFSAREIPTRWGPVTLIAKPSAAGLQVSVDMPGRHPRELNLRLRPAAPVTAARMRVQGTKDWKWDAARQVLSVRGDWKRISVAVR